MNVVFHKNFKRQYKNLPIKVKAQFKRRLTLFIEDSFHPLLHNHALHGEWQDFRSINITGDVRAIYTHVNDDDMVEFVIIDTHSNLYA